MNVKLKKHMACTVLRKSSFSEDVFIKTLFSHLADARKFVKIVLLGYFKMTVVVNTKKTNGLCNTYFHKHYLMKSLVLVTGT